MAVGVDADAIAEAAAEEVVDRGVQRSADEIPERDLDAADRGDRGPRQGALAGEAADHDLVEIADVVRVLADDRPRRRLVHELGEPRRPVRFTETGNTLVRLHFHKHHGKFPCTTAVLTRVIRMIPP